MKDFDELLNEVLKHEAQAESLAGLEQRVLNRVGQQAEESRDRRFGWRIAVAALGVMVWVPLALRHATHEDHLPGTHLSVILPPKGALAQRTAVPGEGRERNRSQVALQRVPASAGMRNARRERKADSLPKSEASPDLVQEAGERRDGWSAIARSPQAVQALAALKEQQQQPIVVAAIEIKPL